MSAMTGCAAAFEIATNGRNGLILLKNSRVQKTRCKSRTSFLNMLYLKSAFSISVVCGMIFCSFGGFDKTSSFSTE